MSAKAAVTITVRFWMVIELLSYLAVAVMRVGRHYGVLIWFMGGKTAIRMW